MKYVFIDCGFYVGRAIQWFLKTEAGQAHNWDVHAFEVCLHQEHMDKFESVTFHKEAVWICDGEMDFYSSGRRRGQANGLFSNPRGRGSKKGEKIRKAKCVDFSKWLNDNFSSDDHIVIKMDIEGAEYEVLQKMINDKTIGMINKLYVEWHLREDLDLEEFIGPFKTKLKKYIAYDNKSFNRNRKKKKVVS